MKSFRSTWATSLIVLGLAAYTVYDYRKAQSEGSYAENERLAFSFSPDQTTELKIIRPGEVIHLSKSGENWQMTEPVEDRADLASLQGYLYALLAERVRTFRIGEDAKTTPNWSEVGLETPAATIEATGSGKTESLSISTKNAFDGSFYVRQKDELLLGGTGFAQLRDRPANSFRSRKLWREEGEVDRADVDFEGDKYSLVKKDGKWGVEPKADFAVDPEKIQEWIDRVQEFMPSEIVKDGIEAKDKSEFLLVKPSFNVKMGKDWILTCGKNRAEDVFVYTNKRDTIYKSSESALSEIRVKRAYFRDGKKAFAFPLEQVRRIEIQNDGLQRVIVKKDSSWSLEGESSQGFELDQAKLGTFLQNVRSLEAKDFLTSGTGFSVPQIVMKDGGGKTLFSFSWGQVIAGRPEVYARTNLENSFISLPKEKIDQLIPQDMVGKKK